MKKYVMKVTKSMILDKIEYIYIYICRTLIFLSIIIAKPKILELRFSLFIYFLKRNLWFNWNFLVFSIIIIKKSLEFKNILPNYQIINNKKSLLVIFVCCRKVGTLGISGEATWKPKSSPPPKNILLKNCYSLYLYTYNIYR